MRCRPIAVCALLFSISFIPGTLLANTRQDALRTLQTLQSRCEEGINYDGYASAFDEAQSQLREFFDSKESEKNVEFADTVERALIAYQSAFVIWKSKLEYRQDLVRSDHPTIRMLLNAYPQATALFSQNGQAPVRGLVSFFWDEADSRISEAKRLISGKGKK